MLNKFEMNKLYHEIIESYSDKNLNRITGKLIELYKNKNYSEIRSIANKVSKYVSIDEEQDAKCFSRLIMLYHPDKGDYYRKNIRQSFLENDLENLEKYAHIRVVENIEEIQPEMVDDDIDYHPEYIWDDDYADDMEEFNEQNNDEEVELEEVEKSFFNAVKLREYGHLEVHYPTWFLRDLEEYEMAYSGINSLYGIEHCRHVIILNLSNNEISDISELWYLTRLEELYLANNEIGYIDILSNLSGLRIIDLSGNQIDDISPLFELKHLEYLNLMGNKIRKEQIEQLKKKDIIVMY
jgi:Leucine-rich repeat (LRR) protein